MILGVSIALGAAGVAFLSSRSRSVAYALFYLAFLAFLTLDPTQGGLVSIDGLESGDNVRWKLAVRAISMAGIAVLAARRAPEVLAVACRPACLPVLFLFAWATLGLPRAQDPWVAFVRLGELLAFFVCGIVLYVEASHSADARDVVRWHALAVVPLLVAAVFFAWLRPEIAFHQDASGIRRMGHKFMNSNVLGFAATVAVLWSSFVARTRLLVGRRDSAPTRAECVLACAVLALGAYVLYHARSRTASLTTLGALAIVWFPWERTSEDLRTRARVLFGAACLCCVALALACAGQIHEWFLRGASTSDVVTGTGRTGLWADLFFFQVPEAPLLGAGYLNLSSAGGFEHAGHFWNNAHNTYLFALVSTGVPGLLCVALIVGWPLAATARHLAIASDFERGTLALVLALQAVIAVASIPGFGVIGYPNALMLFHYGLYAWSTRPSTGQVPSIASLSSLSPIRRWSPAP